MSDFILTDIEVGAKVNILFKFDDKNFEFESSVVSVHKAYVCIEPIILNGKILTLENKNLEICILYTRKDKKPIEWKPCALKTTTENNKKVYAVVTKNNGKEINRRGSYRVYIGEECKVKIKGCEQEFILHDISGSGMSIVSDTEINIGKDEAIFVDFFDPLFHTKLKLCGKLVRTNKLENGKIFYGFKYVKEYENIGLYINKRQKYELEKMARKK